MNQPSHPSPFRCRVPWRGKAYALLPALGFVLATSNLLALPQTQFGDNFDAYSGGSTPGGFAKNGTAMLTNTWTISAPGANRQYRSVMANYSYSGGGIGNSVRQVPYVGGLHRKNFTFSSSLRVVSGSTGYIIGLVGMAGPQPYVSGSYYWFGLEQNGNIFIRSNSTSSTGLTLGTPTNLSGGIVVGTTYTFTVQGTYSGNTLNLAFTITGGANTASLTATASTPLTGLNFGYQHRIGPPGSALTVDMDLFQVDVPMTFTAYWADEFTGTTLNTNVWSKGYRWADVINNELQAHRPENVVVGNGLCTIHVTNPPEPVQNQTMTGYQWGSFDYASGSIQTYDKWTKTYGYFEARIKMPTGRGTWPGFWLLPDRGPSYTVLGQRVQVGDSYNGVSIPMGSEIDIMEYMGAWKDPITQLSKIHHGLIWSYGTTGNATTGYGLENDGTGPTLWYNADGAFHTYGVHWEPGVVTFYLDDKVVLTRQNAAKVPIVPEYMILNVAISQNDWHGNTIPISAIEADMPSRMEIDYVRVYDVAPGASNTRAPLADAYVRDGSYTNANYGTTSNLTVKLDTSSYNRESFLKFSAAGLGSASNVRLRMVPTGLGAAGSTTTLRFEFVSNDAWTETGITWSNKPAGSGTVLATFSGPHTIGQPFEVDVTSQAQAAANGDGVLSIRVTSTSSGFDKAVDLGSREHGTPAYRPVLVY